MERALSQLVRISRAVGKDTSLVQGGGGNISIKTQDGRHMYIKASGTALRDMSGQEGWRRLRLDSVLSIIRDKSISQLETQAREIEVVKRLFAACDDGAACKSRPSVEAHLHAFLDKCVIHLHPVAVLAYCCARNGRVELEKLFKKEKLPPVWVSYTNPGFMLAKKITNVVTSCQKRFGKKPKILFLQKHGLLVSAESSDVALRLLRKVINRCMSKLKRPKVKETKPVSQRVVADAKQNIRKAFFEAMGQRPAIGYFYDDVIAGFWSQRDAGELLLPGALTPDELLYANGPAMWVEDCDSKQIADRLVRQVERGNKPSLGFLVKGTGLFVVGRKKIALTIRDIVKSSFFIRTNALRLGGILTLSKSGRDFINKWESEAFRRKLADG